MLPPVKDLWGHLQTLTAPGPPDTLCLPFIPAAWSSKEEPAPFSIPSCEEKPSCFLWVLPEELKIPILHLSLKQVLPPAPKRCQAHRT